MARTALALLLASRAAALVPTLRTTSISKTISRVSYLSEVEDADKKKKWWDQDDEGREESNPRDHTGVGEADSNYGPTNYEGFIDADGFDGGDGQVGVVGDGKNHMEEFDMSAEDSRGLKGGRKLNQMGGRESKLNAKNAWGTTTGYADELAKRGMVEIDEYGEDKLARRRQQLENWRNQEELRMKKDHQMAKRSVEVQVVLQFAVCRGLGEVLLSGHGRLYRRDVVSEFELTHGLISHRPSSRRCRARSTATSTTAPTSSSSTTGRRTRCRRSRSRA